MEQKPFLPYFPFQINGNIFLDPLLTDSQKTIISLAQLIRLQLHYAKSESEQNLIIKKFSASYFARATNKNRDHIRRKINQMQKCKAVQKYISIFILPKIEFNTEQIFRITFHDNLPDQLNMKRVKEVEAGKEIEWHQESLIQNYLNGFGKLLSGETAQSLIQLLHCDPTELVKGLVYLKEQLRHKKIENPKGYLISSFDFNGNFKYKINTVEFKPLNSETKITDDFLFEVDMENFLIYEKSIDNRDNKFRFFYTRNGKSILINKITEAGRPRNIQNHLKRAGIEFKIVSKIGFENV